MSVARAGRFEQKYNLSARQPAFYLIKSDKTAAHAYETNTEN
jgi:hypothetical protein